MADDCEYDIFVSYSHSDKDLVREHVVRPLEEEGLLVCWDQHFELGSPLLSQIEQGIKSSRRTLVFFTVAHCHAATGFLEREAVVAATQGVREKANRLILIKYGEAEVPPSLMTDVYANARDEKELRSEIKRIAGQIRPNALPTIRFNSRGRVLAVGAHWDDILLGCLGFLIKLRRQCRYHVDVLVLCTSYSEQYYGVLQVGLSKTAAEIHRRACETCEFDNLDELLYKELGNHGNEALHDRFLSAKEPLIRSLLAHVIERSKKSAQRPYNLILCPPMNDMNEDHAVVGRAVFSQFRDPEHTVFEYPIKRYTDSVFVPNLCIGLDDKITVNSESCSVAEEKVRIIEKVCRVTAEINSSTRLFAADALRARMKMHAIDYAKNRMVEYAEVFRGRFEL